MRSKLPGVESISGKSFSFGKPSDRGHVVPISNGN